MGLLLLKSITCLLILLIFYKLILETLSNHKFKRAYLLIAILTSVITPFITFVKYVAPSVDKVLLIDNNTETIPLNTTFKIAEGTNYLAFVLWSLYAIGVSLFLIRFGKNVFGIVSKIKKHEKVKHNNFINVLIHQLEIPHTFFNFIFLNKNKFEHNQIPHEILLHEQTHAKQKHSLDILFIELLQIMFWFNPLLYWLKKEVKLNHEFLADQAVLNQGVDTKNYQNILLAFSSNQQEQALVNAINYSSIKKRFTLMKTQTTKSVAWLRSLLLLPLLGVLIYSFSNTIEIEKETNSNLLQKFENASEKVNSKINYINEINKDEYYKNVTIIFRDKNKNVIATKKYVDLSELERKLLPPPPSKPKKISPTKQQLNNWLDSKKYGIWLDGKKINNNKLSSLSTSSFAHYFESKLAKNALNYGKHYYQIDLYTEDAFNKNWEDTIKPLSKESEIFIYYNQKALSNNKKQISNYTQSATFLENTKLLVNGIECDGCKLNLSKKGIIGLILSTNNKEAITEFKLKIPGIKTLFNEGNMPNNETKQYITRAKQGDIIQVFDIKTKSNKFKPVVIKVVDKNDENYSESPKVKKGDASSIPPPPPPPPVNPNATPEEKAKQEEVIEQYNKENKIIKGKVYKNPPPPPAAPTPPAPLKSDKELVEAKRAKLIARRNQIIAERNKKKSTLKKAKSIERKEALESRRAELIEKRDARKIALQKRRDNMLPPPPPKSPLQHVIDMSKKGATFYYNTNKISSDKAIELIKQNKNLNISSNTDNGNSTVKISEKGIITINDN
ncbi:hypothetical protein JAO71_10310 [Olleya sp. YSTF-M6]|uniref:Peptidase M56 domain-containing protein n=1 Tax=Olleya sediminilitoris TaxID=2795739 RepID=A0ABS1WM65_9FLAO|nr:M56 family metallopeptidase [Olleya sediminilitoris]MBL7560193.1 hypothetical protein [Olleya sediminilitoris]